MYARLTPLEAYRRLLEFPQFAGVGREINPATRLAFGTELDTAAIVICRILTPDYELELRTDDLKGCPLSSDIGFEAMGKRIAAEFLIWRYSKLIVLVDAAMDPHAPADHEGRLSAGIRQGESIVERLRPHILSGFAESTESEPLWQYARFLFEHDPTRTRIVVADGRVWTDTTKHPEPGLFTRSVRF